MKKSAPSIRIKKTTSSRPTTKNDQSEPAKEKDAPKRPSSTDPSKDDKPDAKALRTKRSQRVQGNTTASKKSLCTKTLKALERQYPNPRCALDYSTPFQLMVAVVLSAQCTDKRVNMVTPNLFKRFATPEEFADASVEDIEEEIKSCGFYHAKAVNLSNASKLLVEKFHGTVPNSLEELIQLPGVGRKTANCILGNAFGIASGFVVDTHVLRLSRKIGLSDNATPEKVEADLNALFPQSEWIDASHRLILLGREFCIARRPKCELCPLGDFCLKRD